MKKIIFISLLFLFFAMNFVSCNSKEEPSSEENDLLPGSEVTAKEALRESMIVPVSKETFYDSPLVAICKTLEDASLVNDKFNVLQASQKVKVIEVLYGNIEEKFTMEYTVFEGKGERALKKDEAFLCIFKGDKREGYNKLLKVYPDNEKNKKEIKETLENLLISEGEDMRSKEKAFKGMELYSWQAGDTWFFSLLPGTNRNKPCSEVTESYNTIDSLKVKLALLPEGENVFWSNRTDGEIPQGHSDLSYPPEEIIEELVEWCKKFNIELIYKWE